MQIKRWETLEGFNAVVAYVAAKDEFHDFRLGNIEWRGEQLRIAIEGEARVWYFTFTGVSELEFDMDCVLPAYVTEMGIKGHNVLLDLKQRLVFFPSAGGDRGDSQEGGETR